MPTSRGFDYYLGVPYSVDMGNSVWKRQTVPGDNGVLPLVQGTAREGFRIIEQPAKLENLTARYVDAATGWIRQQANDDKRFVLYVPFSHVHNPQFCSSEWCGSSTVVGGGPAVPTGHGGTGSAVQEMDAAVGAILDSVRANPALDMETLTFFTSDNGAPSNHALNQTAGTLNETANGVGSNYPLRGFKGSVLEGGIRMPAIVRWPGKIKPGSVTDELAATYDIFTTVSCMTGFCWLLVLLLILTTAATVGANVSDVDAVGRGAAERPHHRRQGPHADPAWHWAEPARLPLQLSLRGGGTCCRPLRRL